MIMKKQHLIYIIVAVLVIGCVQIKKPLEEITGVPKERSAEEYIQKGREYEDKGDMVAALKQYKLAMAVDSKNKEAIKSRNRVEIELRRSAEEHYKAGLKFHKKGEYDFARHQFLIALRLRPDHPEVIKMLLISRKGIRIEKYIVHTTKPGESLSKVAMIYYGDYKMFPIISIYNNIIDASRIKVGQKIKVPEIEGKEFLVGKEAIKTEKVEVAEVKEEEKKPVDQVAIYRDLGVALFEEKKYREAIVVFNKVLNVQPEDSLALEYSCKANFQEGIYLFEKKDYLAAKDQFEVCLRHKTDCQKCHGYIKKSENFYKEMHYKKGMHFFNKQQLPEAIKEWELVRVIDLNYKRVNYLINKANTILKKIEELKESQEKKL